MMHSQRSWILDSYLSGKQDGQGWALIDNSDADDVRHNLETAIERMIVQRIEVAALRAERDRLIEQNDGLYQASLMLSAENEKLRARRPAG